MSVKYHRHDVYRESGVQHLREVPDAWETRQLKRAVEGCINGIWGSEPTGGNEDIVVIRVADFDRPRLGIKDADYTSRSVSVTERNRRLLNPGDLLLEKSGGGEKTPVGQVVMFDREFEAVCSNFVAKMTPLDGYDSAYLNYSFSALYRDGINFCSIKQNTGIQNLDSNSYLSEHWAFPSHDEQTQIAKFLDYETAKIDALIEKQQQLIALLKEKRQAAISHAVTKGLNPDAPMRDSGVEWLGEVPAHWATAKLGHRYEVLLGKMLDASKVSGDFLGRYLRNTDVQWGRINEENLPEMDFRPHERERYSVRMGDLIVCEGGEIGRCAIWTKDYTCFYQKALHRLRPKHPSKDVTRFMYYHLLLAVVQDRFLAGSEKATIAHLPAESFKQYKFCFPAYDEQRTIADALDTLTEKFDELEGKANDQIELLQERRTALISAAVTGKIDVRGWKPPESKPQTEAA